MLVLFLGWFNINCGVIEIFVGFKIGFIWVFDGFYIIIGELGIVFNVNMNFFNFVEVWILRYFMD